ncbi:MAG TPA: phospholipid carrier-dependent glycosyltransferase [Anaerolineae bacterium]
MSAYWRTSEARPILAASDVGGAEPIGLGVAGRIASVVSGTIAGQVLIATVALGLVLRLWGLNFGLPYDYHYDEHFYINAALQLGTGNINYEPFMPRGLSNVEAVAYGGYYLLGRLTHLFSSAADFERAYRSDPTVFYVLARLFVALTGTGTCLAVFWLTRRTAGPKVALIAAGLLAIGFGHVRESHFAVPDVPPALLITLAVALTTVGVADSKKRYILAAGVLAGVATAFKWTSLLALAVPLLGALLSDTRSQPEAGRQFRYGTILLTLLSCAAGFAVASPQVLLNPMPYLRMAVLQAQSGEAGGYEVWRVDVLPGWLFYAKTLYLQLGAVAFALAVWGAIARLVRVIRTRDRMSMVLLAFPFIYFGLMGATRHYFVRYAVPLLPFTCVFAAEAIAGAGRWAAARRLPVAQLVAPALLLAALAQPLASSIRLDQLLVRTDTRTLAKDWIEANLPQGAKIAVDWRIHTPPLSTPDRVRAAAAKVYDVTYVEGTGLSDRSIEEYRQQGFEYLIASSFIYNLTVVDPKQDAARQASYARLGRELPILQTFRPYEGATALAFVFDEMYGPFVSLWQRERPGPTIIIYRLRQ